MYDQVSENPDEAEVAEAPAEDAPAEPTSEPAEETEPQDS